MAGPEVSTKLGTRAQIMACMQVIYKQYLHKKSK